jgi:hypothetical protein
VWRIADFPRINNSPYTGHRERHAHVSQVEAANYSRSKHTNPIRIDLMRRIIVNRHPSDKLCADIAIVGPRRRILRIVARIEQRRTGASNRKLATADIALVAELEQRALGMRESVKARKRELDQRDVAGLRNRVGAARCPGSAQRKTPIPRRALIRATVEFRRSK